ncbi:MAG: hypothetical protein RR297_11475 [Clostridia bacterium]
MSKKEIAARKPADQNRYDVSVDAPNVPVSFITAGGDATCVFIYACKVSAFQLLKTTKKYGSVMQFPVRLLFGLRCNCSKAHFTFVCVFLKLATKKSALTGSSVVLANRKQSMIPAIIDSALQRNGEEGAHMTPKQDIHAHCREMD